MKSISIPQRWGSPLTPKGFVILDACLIGLVSGLAAVLLRQGVDWLELWRIQTDLKTESWLRQQLSKFVFCGSVLMLGASAGVLFGGASAVASSFFIPQLCFFLLLFLPFCPLTPASCLKNLGIFVLVQDLSYTDKSALMAKIYSQLLFQSN